MNTVFIFGAGASHEAGGPLMNDFFDKAESILRNLEIRNQILDVKNDFDDVLNAIYELHSIYAKAHIDLNNFYSHSLRIFFCHSIPSIFVFR